MVALAPCPAAARNFIEMSPVPPATSSRRSPGRGRIAAMNCDFQIRWMPPLIRSFIRS